MLRTKRVLLAAAAALLPAITPALSSSQEARDLARLAGSKQQETRKLIAVLQSDAPLHERAVACKRLAVVGEEEAVPVLAALLSDEELSHYARFALEPLPSPSVDAALRAALAKVKGRFLIGVINSIGNRRDAGAADELTKLLGDSDPQVCGAAAAALGRIGNSQTAATLKQTLASAPTAVAPAVADACLACAEELLGKGRRQEAADLYDSVRKAKLPKRFHVAATRGAILTRQSAAVALIVEQLEGDDEQLVGAALRAARELGGHDVAKALIAQLDHSSPKRQVLLLLALRDLGDAAALPALLDAAKSGPPEVRLAAIRCLQQLPSDSAAPLLLAAALESEPEIAQAAQAALAVLPGKQADQEIVAGLDRGSRETRLVMMDLAGRRRIASAVPLLLKAADDPDVQIRLAAIKGLGETVDAQDLPALMNRIIKPRTDEESTAAREALKAACARMPDQDACVERIAAFLPQSPAEAKLSMLELIGSVGGTKALEVVAARARDADPDIQDAATRILGEWMSPDAAPELLKLAKTLDNNKFKVRALRGYIRIVRQLGLDLADRIAMCREALAAAQRDDEKKLVLDALQRCPSPEALSMVVPYLDNRALRGAAQAAALAIAERIVEEHRAAAAKAMQRVLDTGARNEQAARAKALLERASK